MFEKFTSTGWREFSQRYEGTHGFYRDEKKKKILVRLAGINADRCAFVDSKGTGYSLNSDSKKDIGFEFIPPEARFHNTIEGPVLVQRKAQRQFQRGISSKNTTLHVLQSTRFLQANVDFPILEQIYLNPLDHKTAFERFKVYGTACAISDQIAINGVGNVFLWDKRIGSFTRRENHLAFKLEEPALWRTELADAAKAIGCTIEVA